jgi:photosystem II stability/assembly factor-like uncharacterized protein
MQLQMGGSKSIVKSTNYGTTFNSYIHPSSTSGGLNDRPFVMSPSDRNTLYVGYSELYRTSNGGSSWQKISDFQNESNGWQTTEDMKAIGLAHTDPELIIVAFSGPTWAAANQSRLFKTTDGGQTWIDISSSLGNVIHWTTITDINISPVDPNKIWISFSGYWINSNGNAINKVWFTEDGGTYWSDETNNLPDLPVNCLTGIMINQTNRAIIGNDVGIFLFDPLQNSWQNISNGLPHVVVSDIEVDYSNGQILIGSYGRGIWKTQIPCDIVNESITITTNTTWNEKHLISGTLTVEPTATLTLKSILALTEESTIIVKPGAQLILDGAILTNGCEKMWQGIQVWGNKNESQYTLPGQLCEQGKLTLKNGATIESAIVAVDLWKPGDYSTSGGIVDATGATFRNNAQAVHAMPYRNISPFNPNAELSNLSNFKYCTFEITEDYLGDETFYRHADLAQVKGIDFEACSFSLAENVEGVSTWNSAITGFDAQFNVKGVCTSQQVPCPEEDYDRSTFTGFYVAVNALNDGTNHLTFNVSRADFTNNTNGVKTRNMNNASVLFSNFEIGHLWDCGTGIHSDNVTGFAYEENNFSKFAGAPVSDYFGIIINNSEAANDVYKNTFSGLSYANFSDGKNWEKDDRWKGLAYYCNENSNNYADFYVADYISPNHSGIQSEQGGNSYTAGNTFTQTGATWHFYNGGEHLVGYYHNLYTGNETPDDDKIFHVAKIGRSVANACPSHYGGSPGIDLVISPQQRADAEQTYYNNLTDYNSTHMLYDSYVDGGNTDATLLDIQTAQPDDMWELRSKLLGESPHLSFDVLKEAADKTDVLT